MSTKRITPEHLLYFLAFALALSLRLLNLGQAPLSDFEAGWALQAWEAARGGLTACGPNPGYVMLTSAAFMLLDGGNALARLWPAMAGSLLVLSPFAFRRLLGRKAALVLAFGLALDPGLVALSRLAGGPMLAIGCGVFALAFIYARRPIWAGICGGLALLSGPSVLTGLAGFAIAWGVARWAGIAPRRDDVGETASPSPPAHSGQNPLRTGLIFGAGTILLAGSLFFHFPTGLGAWAATLPVYLKGWALPSGIPAARLFAAILFYQPWALIFGIVAAVRGWVRADKLARWLSLWALAALAAAIFYPGRQVFDAAWVLLPLWALAALELARYLRVPQASAAAYGQAAVIFVLLVLVWLVGSNLAAGKLTWVVLIIAPLLGALTSVLVAMGYSWDAARSGLVWGASAALGVFVIAAVFSVSQLRPNGAQELWPPPPAVAQADLLVATLNELAVMQSGQADTLDIVSLVDVPSLQWALRNFTDVSFVSSLAADAYPTAIITLEDSVAPNQTASYRGQDFVWVESPGWEGALPPDWFRWMTSRQAPVWPESVIVWARADLFPADHRPPTDADDQPPTDAD